MYQLSRFGKISQKCWTNVDETQLNGKQLKEEYGVKTVNVLVYNKIIIEFDPVMVAEWVTQQLDNLREQSFCPEPGLNPA